MQPSEPAREETSLELTFPDHDVNPPPPPVGFPELMGPTASPVPTAPTASPEPTPGPLGDLVAAHFRRVEVAMLGRVLVTTLSGALPASMVRVERRRALGRRLTGRPGEPIGVTVTAGDRTLSFRAPEVGVCQATVGHTVHGVVLSTTSVPVAQWLDELGALLDGLTRDDEATRAALERALLT